MRHLESQLQQACIKWLRLQYPKVVAFAIPNGGKRNAREAARMKSEGVLAGVPDLFIAAPRGVHAGLFIELKAGKGRMSEAQTIMRDRLNDAGYCTALCRTLEEFQSTVKWYVSRPSVADNDPVQLLSA